MLEKVIPRECSIVEFFLKKKGNQRFPYFSDLLNINFHDSFHRPHLTCQLFN